MRLHDIKLKKGKGPSGEVVNGLWESESVRMEAVDGGWQCDVPMRDVGAVLDKRTGVYEFRSLELGGKWTRVGTYRTRDACCIIAERLMSGVYVWRTGYTCESGPVDSTILRWADVAEFVATKTAA
jgi:hypothetical protein